MAETSYQQFCPVAMAAEILCTRWTMLVLRELLCGSTRFNELRRGLPRMSPALLSQRLKEQEEADILERRPVKGEPNIHEYRLTPSGEELRPIVIGLGSWGHRWVASEISLDRLDAPLLMWDMRRNLRTEPLPSRRVVIQFRFPGAPTNARAWWLIASPDEPVDLCSVDPGHDVDLFVQADLRAMTAVWMGIEDFTAPCDDGRIVLAGDERLAGTMRQWLGRSHFAEVARAVA
jgi:DNA-binding HxlR family transcriptional regulator